MLLDYTFYFDMQATKYAPVIHKGESPGGSAAEVESDDESIADLPLNLVATQMAETETH